LEDIGVDLEMDFLEVRWLGLDGGGGGGLLDMPEVVCDV
jgi:hypothetical protein